MKSLLPLLLLAVLAACTTHADTPEKLSDRSTQILRTATNVVLFSVDPATPISEQAARSDRYLHGYKILGQTTIDAKKSKRIATNLESEIANGANKMSAKCFNPRHVLRMTADNQTCDFLICYECGRLAVESPGKVSEYLRLSGKPDELNAILKSAKIPLAK